MTPEDRWNLDQIVPWSWNVTEEQLMEVDGIGKGRAARMMSAVGIRHHPTDKEEA